MSALKIPAENAPAEYWGRLAVRIPGYQWPWSVDRRARGVCLPGYVRRHQTTTWEWIEDISVCSMLDECAPDPDDPATAGCLLRLLGDTLAHISTGFGDGYVVCIIVDGDTIEGTGRTLGRACIAAAAANGRWPGGGGTGESTDE